MDWLFALVVGIALGAGAALIFLLPTQRKALAASELRGDQAEMSLDLAEMVGKMGTWSLDLSTNALSWSDEVFRMHERPIHLGPPSVAEAIDCYHPDDRKAVQMHVENAVSKGEDYEFELRLLLPSGDVRNVISRGTCRFDSNGKVNGLYGAIVELPGS